MRRVVPTLCGILLLAAGCGAPPSTPPTPPPTSVTQATSGAAASTTVAAATATASSASTAIALPGVGATATAGTKPTAMANPEREDVVRFVAAVGPIERDHQALLDEIGEWARCCRADASQAASVEKERSFLVQRRTLARRLIATPEPALQEARLARGFFAQAYAEGVEAYSGYLAYLEGGDLAKLGEASARMDNYTSTSRQARDALATLVEKYHLTPQEVGLSRFP